MAKRLLQLSLIGIGVLIMIPIYITAQTPYYLSNHAITVTLNKQEVEYCDSIFNTVQNLPTASERISKITSYYDENKEYTKVFLDSALQWSIKSELPVEQARVHSLFYEYYWSEANKAGIDSVFEHLKQNALNHPSKGSYYYYFEIWAKMIQDQILTGEIEKARFELEDMVNESNTLNNSDGRFFSYFLSVLLLSTENAVENSSLISDYLSKASEIDDLSFLQQRWLLSRYYLLHLRSGEVDKARMALNQEIEVLNETVKAHPEQKKKLESVFLRNYVRLSDLFDKQTEADSVKKYLLLAQNYYDSTAVFSSYLNYQLQWARYYYAVGNLEMSLLHYDLALEKGKSKHPSYLINIHVAKVKLLTKLGRTQEAATLYKEVILNKISLNDSMLESHQVAHEKNFQIKQLLQKQLERKHTIYLCIALAMFLVVLILVYFTYRVWRSERKIKRKRAKINELYGEVGEEKKQRRFFLNKIVKEIKVPLDAIIESGKQLSLNEQITQEQRQYHSKLIKNSTSRLLNLVLNVLDLSRLEVHMVKYQPEESNLVTLCQRTIEGARMREERLHEFSFLSEEKNLMVKVDPLHLYKMIFNALSSPYELEKPLHTLCFLERRSEQAVITIKNSPLFYFVGEEIEIQRQIIQLSLEQLGGAYQEIDSQDGKMIEMTFPTPEA